MIVFIVIVNVIICNYISMARVHVFVCNIIVIFVCVSVCVCLYEARVHKSRVSKHRFGLSRVLNLHVEGVC